MNLRREKGSITLFVLVSCMFFIASIACVQIYMQSKQTAVDREYRQIKSNYEQNNLEENTLKEDYEQLSKLTNMGVTIVNTTKLDNGLKVEFTLSNPEANIKTLKYGWGTNASVDTVTSWTFMENSNGNESRFAFLNGTIDSGDYHLFVVVNDKVIYNKITV